MRGREVTQAGVDRGHVVEDQGDLAMVAGCPCQGEGLVLEEERLVGLAAEPRILAERQEGLHQPRRIAESPRGRDGSLAPTFALVDGPDHQPEHAGRPEQPQNGIRVVAGDRPVEGETKVLTLGHAHDDPGVAGHGAALAGATPRRPSDREVVGEVTVARRGGLTFGAARSAANSRMVSSIE